MKKITQKEAKLFISTGTPVKAKISSREIVPVSTLNELDNLIRLKDSKVQDLELYYEPFAIPDDAMELSFDEAFGLVSSGETVCGVHNEEEVSISDVNSLTKFYKVQMSREKVCHLYWYV